MSGSSERRGRLLRRWGRFPTEQDWETSVVLEPRAVALEPGLISDGAGLPFAPAALHRPAGQLDPGDPAVGGLAALLSHQKPAVDGTSPRLEDWRILARSEGEVLFGRGMPPRLITVAMRRDGRRDTWRSLAVTTGGTLRTTRDGVRASSWHLDPEHPVSAEEMIIRVLVTEQTRSGGALADKRLLVPDLHEDDDQLVLTMFVTPRSGVQMASATLATPARVRLPSPIGERPLLDGALYTPG